MHVIPALREEDWGRLETRQAGALLIIMSSLQVSQRTVGGSGGGVDNMREQTKKNWCIFKRLCEISKHNVLGDKLGFSG